jgi:hypothetical protein
VILLFVSHLHRDDAGPILGGTDRSKQAPLPGPSIAHGLSRSAPVSRRQAFHESTERLRGSIIVPSRRNGCERAVGRKAHNNAWRSLQQNISACNIDDLSVCAPIVATRRLLHDSRCRQGCDRSEMPSWRRPEARCRSYEAKVILKVRVARWIVV